MEAIRITDPDQLKSTLSSSFSRPGAKLIEVMVNKLSPLSYSAALVLTPVRYSIARCAGVIS
jgi:hypothetical protein